MSKKVKTELTPEELAAKKIRKSNGWTRFWAIVLALALTVGVFSVAKSQGAKVAASDEETVSTTSAGGGSTENNNSTDSGNSDSVQVNSDNSSDGSSSDVQSSDSTVNTDEIAAAINAATAKAVNEKAGYTWKRSAQFTEAVDVGTATSILNGIIQAVDENANLNSVVGGFLGVGDKEATIGKGEDAAAVIDYHGDSYKLKATQLKGSDLLNLQVNGDTYTFNLADVNTPAKDGSSSLSRLTDDIVVIDEVSEEVTNYTSAISVNSLEANYTNIKVTVVITDGKLVSLAYEDDAAAKLGLKAVVSITGTGAIHTSAQYTDFVY